jgi:asparagine synthase (glutamine-hydrolysing)
MCGIVGQFTFSGSPPGDGRAFVSRACEVIAHRGPDDSGIYESEDRRVVLGHRRLSIVDLSPAGHQPMSNEDGRIWITFNGEIYNHRQFRDELVSKGHVFRSNSDTEAIIHLYEEYGPAWLRHLDGMFAFALWDAAADRLVLARDRLGKKPLYYIRLPGQLLFASEIKALLVHPRVRRELDTDALNEFLTFSNVPAPRTLFAGIKKLPAAHRLICDARGEIRIERYWSPLEAAWPQAISEREATEQVSELLQTAVRKRLMADVPVGCFLSGGLDSSTNVALMSRLQSTALQTFSVGFHGFGPAENFHDLPFARLVANQFGCRHSEIMVSAQECQAHLPELVVQQDEPLGDPACLPMHFVCKAAHATGLKVVLVGEGSDEVFGGYDDMVSILQKTMPRWSRLMRAPRLIREAVYQLVRQLGAPAGRVDLLRRAARGEPLYWGLDVVFWETEKKALLTHAARKQMRESPAAIIRGYCEALFAAHPQADGLQQMSYVELCNRLPELLLMRVDKISMAHSIEARAPFLDYQLSSYALGLPAALKIHGRSTKHVLRNAVTPFLPREVLERSKQGFRVPLPEWLAGDLADWAGGVLADSGLRKLDLFNWAQIERMWAAHKNRQADFSFDLWCLLNLSAWYDHWIERAPA